MQKLENECNDEDLVHLSIDSGKVMFKSPEHKKSKINQLITNDRSHNPKITSEESRFNKTPTEGTTMI